MNSVFAIRLYFLNLLQQGETMLQFAYLNARDYRNDQKRAEYNARLNRQELSIKGIVKNGEDYLVAVTIFMDHIEAITPEKCRELALDLSRLSGEDVSVVEFKMTPKRKVLYFVLENCLRIVEDGVKIYENDNGNISKIAIPLGNNIYKYHKKRVFVKLK